MKLVGTFTSSGCLNTVGGVNEACGNFLRALDACLLIALPVHYT